MAMDGQPEGSLTTAAPSPTSWAALVALGSLNALWAVFLWGQLVLARSGGSPFCSFKDAAECAAVWDSAFASAVHGHTGLPIAGWGVAWGLLGFALPLVGLALSAQARPVAAIVSATRLSAAAGLVAVFVLMAVSASLRAFCPGCFVTYVLAGGYAGIALFGWNRFGLPESGGGLALSLGGMAAAFALLLYPGMHTPRTAGESGRTAIALAARSEAGASAPAAEDTSPDPALRQLVASLDPGQQQTLSDSLDVYRRSDAKAMPAPRVLLGAERAPVRITEFTDVLCSHCADLQKTLDALREHLPEGSFSIEPRQFPLDGTCNALVPGKGAPLRCLAAKARICLEGQPGAEAFAAALFENQETLDAARVFALAAPYVERRALEACVASESTRAKLEDDIRFAAQYDPDGTPLVLINGRKGTSFGPFLFAMVVSGGEASLPAFDLLPPPDPNAHVH